MGIVFWSWLACCWSFVGSAFGIGCFLRLSVCFLFFERGVAFLMPGWWLKVIFQGGQGGGAYLGREGWGWERGLTRGGTATTTTSNA